MLPAAQPPPKRQESTFQTRTATDDAGEPNRGVSTVPEQQDSPMMGHNTSLIGDSATDNHNPYDPTTNASTPPPRRHSFTKKSLHLHDGPSDFWSPSGARRRSGSSRRRPQDGLGNGDQSSAAPMHKGKEHRKGDGETSNTKPGLGPRPVGGQEKLGTFSGVFVPTCLNVLSILMFLRFGFILGQGGVLGMMGELQNSRRRAFY